MADFKEKPNAATAIKVLQAHVPHIVIHSDALAKMQVYVEHMDKEIGWLGTAYQYENTIEIRDVFLFDQEVHATTTEITPEGLSDFAQELLLQPDGMDVWNNMKMWGHSHVNMPVNPSGQDDKQMETFQEGGHDWFIRLIANKQGDIKIDMYNYQNGTIFIDLPWVEGSDAESSHIKQQIAALFAQLTNRKKTFKSSIEAPIKAEIKMKIREKGYATQHTAYGNSPYGSYYHRTSEQTFTAEKNGAMNGKDTLTLENGSRNKGKKNERIEIAGEWTVFNPGFEVPDREDIIASLNDMDQFFCIQDVLRFGECRESADVLDELINLGYENFFSDHDIVQIWKFSMDYCRTYGLID